VEAGTASTLLHQIGVRMNVSTKQSSVVMVVFLLLAGCGNGTVGTGSSGTNTPAAVTIANLQQFSNTNGSASTYTNAGVIDESGVFFQPLGTNGRTCATCHQASQDMALSADNMQALFTSTSGSDPLFNAVDGANCPTVLTGDTAGHSLILSKALIRVAVTLPTTAQFTITTLHDPYGCATTLSSTGAQIVSVYRRPLPTASLPYLSAVMWDTRETLQPLTSATTFSANLDTDLTQQALDAVSTHEQGLAVPTAAQTAAIVAFEEGLYTAQAVDSVAGSLTANGGKGGAANLVAQNYYPGINDAFGGDPTGAAFNPVVFTLYQSWRNSTNPAQASIARGEDIFNTAPLTITNVRGINDNTALGSPAALRGSCSTCHDAPNVGSHSLPLTMDTGTSRLAADETNQQIINGVNQLAAADVPIYQISGCTDALGHPVTYTTTDPGKGLFTGLCADVNRVKTPSLRGLAARSPYFHNGSAATIQELVNFYDARFQMGLNPQQKTDLENFLNTL
jgi:cytochrome c peroxidase